MKYPIDVDKYIAAMRRVTDLDSTVEQAYRETILPFMNECYAAGQCRKDGFPLDLEKEIKVYADISGEPLELLQTNYLLPLLIAWANNAYAQGRQDAENEEGAT